MLCPTIILYPISGRFREPEAPKTSVGLQQETVLTLCALFVREKTGGIDTQCWNKLMSRLGWSLALPWWMDIGNQTVSGILYW